MLIKQEQRAERLGLDFLNPIGTFHTTCVRRLGDRMKNPNSFEHSETRVQPVDSDGRKCMLVKYSAENGFGGMSVGEALGHFDQDT